jgi:hypothetical protein
MPPPRWAGADLHEERQHWTERFQGLKAPSKRGDELSDLVSELANEPGIQERLSGDLHDAQRLRCVPIQRAEVSPARSQAVASGSPKLPAPPACCASAQ